MVAAVMYCQNDTIVDMQSTADRFLWLRKYAPEDRITNDEHVTLLQSSLVSPFKTDPPGVKYQEISNRDARAKIFRKIWTVCCFRATTELEEASMCVAAAAEDRRARDKLLKQEAEAKKRAHDVEMAKAARKRKAPEPTAAGDMVAAAASVVESAASCNPNDPRLKRLRALFSQ